MTDAIAVLAPKDLTEAKSLAKELSMSALMPAVLRKKSEDIYAIVIAGAELGLAPMQALRGMHIINGKIAMSADLLGALVKSKPACEYLMLLESSGAVATYETKRRGDPKPTTLSFTTDQAKAAGLLGNPNYQKYPDAMLRARALAAICRAVYPDLCMGIYDSDSGELDVPTLERSDAQGVPASHVAHVEAVKEAVKATVSRKPEPVVDAEFTPTLSGAASEIAARMNVAVDAGTLTALAGEVKAGVDAGKLTADDRTALLGVYAKRKAALTPTGAA
jgi:hypothetical protein